MAIYEYSSYIIAPMSIDLNSFEILKYVIIRPNGGYYFFNCTVILGQSQSSNIPIIIVHTFVLWIKCYLIYVSCWALGAGGPGENHVWADGGHHSPQTEYSTTG